MIQNGGQNRLGWIKHSQGDFSLTLNTKINQHALIRRSAAPTHTALFKLFSSPSFHNFHKRICSTLCLGTPKRRCLLSLLWRGMTARGTGVRPVEREQTLYSECSSRRPRQCICSRVRGKMTVSLISLGARYSFVRVHFQYDAQDQPPSYWWSAPTCQLSLLHRRLSSRVYSIY